MTNYEYNNHIEKQIEKFILNSKMIIDELDYEFIIPLKIRKIEKTKERNQETIKYMNNFLFKFFNSPINYDIRYYFSFIPKLRYKLGELDLDTELIRDNVYLMDEQGAERELIIRIIKDINEHMFYINKKHKQFKIGNIKFFNIHYYTDKRDVIGKKIINIKSVKCFLFL